MLEQYPEIMTPEQVAEILQLSVEEVNESFISNEIPAKKIGKFWRIPKASLIDFLNPQNNSQPPILTPVVEKPSPNPVSSETSKDIASPIEETKTIPSIDEKALEKLLEIQARFTAQIESVQLSLKEPDFACPNDMPLGVQNIWNASKNKYDNAKKINELGKNFGRIRDIINTFLKLNETYQNSESFHRHLAYLSYLSGDTKKAIDHYKKAAWIAKQSSENWLSVAILARQTQPELTCYALEQFFAFASPFEFKNAWYLHIGLVRQFQNYVAILEILENHNRELSGEEQTFLLESGIYLMKVLEKEGTIEFVQKLLKGLSLRAVAIEVFTIFETSVTDILKQLSQAMKAESETFLKKPIVKTIPATPPAIQTATTRYSTNSSYLPLPKGKNPYARAKTVCEREKNFPKAIELYNQAIQEGDNVESAVKDLASLLARMERADEAIETLEKYRNKISNQQSIDNMLINIYQKAGDYKKSVELLKKLFDKTSAFDPKKTQLRWQIAYCEMKQEHYTEAGKHFSEVLRVQSDNISAKRNLAICLFKQNRFNDAKNLLEKILKTVPDAKTTELYELIKKAESGGHLSSSDDVLIQSLLSDYTSEISNFVKFFLKRCDLKGVDPNRIQENERGEKLYIGSAKDSRSDLEKLEDSAKVFGTRVASERAEYYLSAAKIVEKSEDANKFYQYLCRSFTSKADAIVVEKRHVDSARELYCEALNIYDGYRVPKDSEDAYDEQDAVNALCRFLYACFSRDKIPNTPPKRDEKESVLKQQLQYIDNSLLEVVTNHPQKDKIFDAISYLIFRSRHAANRILNSLFNKALIRPDALQYLKSKEINTNDVKKLEDFIPLWNKLSEKHDSNFREILGELGFIRNKFDLTTATIEEAIKHISLLTNIAFFELDKQRFGHLQEIFNQALELCKQSAFEDKERLCETIKNRCQKFLREIEESPTRLSIEEIYTVVETVQNTVSQYLNEVYETSAPQLEIRLAQDMDSYTPDDIRQIEVQIVIGNPKGCSPAESIELVIQKDNELFSIIQREQEISLEGSLRGGDSRTISIPLQVSQQAMEVQVFSLSVQVKYNTRNDKGITTAIENFSIRLYPQSDFEEIDNPYSTYAEGGIVDNPKMFYGRDELIANIANALQKSKDQSKCVVIFGQKRAGKSSTLAHLKRCLQKESNNLVLDLGNIGSILDEESSTSFLYQILWGILAKLRDSIEDKIDEGFSSIDLSFPQDVEFYKHPSPLNYFKDFFNDYKRKSAKLEKWKDLRIVLLIDEFSYIYGQIAKGRIPDTFMKNWKALLQENYFNAVLVGQDVMTKFKQRFPNEFGTTQDERVSYLKEEDARRLIDEPIRIGGKQGKSRYVERAIDKIVDLTAGSPFYIQIICNRLVERMNSKHEKLASDAHVEIIKNELIRGVNAMSIDKFDNLINSGDVSPEAIKDRDIIKVLTEIAKNSQTSNACNRNNINCATETPIDDILEDLVKRDVLEHDRTYYCIRVGLFKEWLFAHQ